MESKITPLFFRVSEDQNQNEEVDNHENRLAAEISMSIDIRPKTAVIRFPSFTTSTRPSLLIVRHSVFATFSFEDLLAEQPQHSPTSLPPLGHGQGVQMPDHSLDPPQRQAMADTRAYINQERPLQNMPNARRPQMEGAFLPSSATPIMHHGQSQGMRGSPVYGQHEDGTLFEINPHYSQPQQPIVNQSPYINHRQAQQAHMQAQEQLHRAFQSQGHALLQTPQATNPEHLLRRAMQIQGLRPPQFTMNHQAPGYGFQQQPQQQQFHQQQFQQQQAPPQSVVYNNVQYQQQHLLNPRGPALQNGLRILPHLQGKDAITNWLVEQGQSGREMILALQKRSQEELLRREAVAASKQANRKSHSAIEAQHAAQQARFTPAVNQYPQQQTPVYQSYWTTFQQGNPIQQSKPHQQNDLDQQSNFVQQSNLRQQSDLLHQNKLLQQGIQQSELLEKSNLLQQSNPFQQNKPSYENLPFGNNPLHVQHETMAQFGQKSMGVPIQGQMLMSSDSAASVPGTQWAEDFLAHQKVVSNASKHIEPSLNANSKSRGRATDTPMDRTGVVSLISPLTFEESEGEQVAADSLAPRFNFNGSTQAGAIPLTQENDPQAPFEEHFPGDWDFTEEEIKSVLGPAFSYSLDQDYPNATPDAAGNS
ncbi:hypothetical protein EJ08DRAFT_676147 [Tothia fuscella]|uniref:Uncharacterized protein n=1 Tax=Tothia fuscella TaxID=1048955 RepID=A0A9P4U1U3_9PEZI|nr:hypothetical protein EJ08DRAFT_676147 [Tothia fuscella]